MKNESGTTSEIFTCYTCGKQWEDYNNARKKAYHHAKNTGHRVSGEVVKKYSYNVDKNES